MDPEELIKQASESMRAAIDAAEGRAEEIIREAEQEAQRIRSEAEATAQRARSSAEAEAQRRLDEVRSALDALQGKLTGASEVQPGPVTVPEPEPPTTPEPTPEPPPEPMPPPTPEPTPDPLPSTTFRTSTRFWTRCTRRPAGRPAERGAPRRLQVAARHPPCAAAPARIDHRQAADRALGPGGDLPGPGRDGLVRRRRLDRGLLHDRRGVRAAGAG